MRGPRPSSHAVATACCASMRSSRGTLWHEPVGYTAQRGSGLPVHRPRPPERIHAAAMLPLYPVHSTQTTLLACMHVCMCGAGNFCGAVLGYFGADVIKGAHASGHMHARSMACTVRRHAGWQGGGGAWQPCVAIAAAAAGDVGPRHASMHCMHSLCPAPPRPAPPRAALQWSRRARATRCARCACSTSRGRHSGGAAMCVRACVSCMAWQGPMLQPAACSRQSASQRPQRALMGCLESVRDQSAAIMMARTGCWREPPGSAAQASAAC